RSASALQYFREAVERAPDFAEAWAALALQHIARGNSGPASDRGAHYAQARSAAFAALERNPRLGEAHTALGTLAFYFDWDWEAADRSFRQALEYAPGDAFAYQRYSMFLAALGRLDEAIDAARLSQAIEPMVPTRSSSLGTTYYYARRYEEAAAEMQRALDLSPRFATAEYGLGRIRASQGRFDEAITHLTRAAELGSPVSAFLELARVHALHGDVERSAAAIEKLGALQPLPDITPDNLAFVDAAHGELDTAFARLAAALTLRAGNLLWIRVDPRFDPLRNDPRFESLVRRLQFP
ncbi:MAG: tetratricopeptide repeat protein, partial [Acidobacteriota bacterium]|nr:tetratricopeptide repeat protein [Acidobacteriota bacterium]